MDENSAVSERMVVVVKYIHVIFSTAFIIRDLSVNVRDKNDSITSGGMIAEIRLMVSDSISLLKSVYSLCFCMRCMIFVVSRCDNLPDRYATMSITVKYMIVSICSVIISGTPACRRVSIIFSLMLFARFAFSISL